MAFLSKVLYKLLYAFCKCELVSEVQNASDPHMKSQKFGLDPMRVILGPYKKTRAIEYPV